MAGAQMPRWRVLNLVSDLVPLFVSRISQVDFPAGPSGVGRGGNKSLCVLDEEIELLTG